MVRNRQPAARLVAAMFEFDPEIGEAALKAEREAILKDGRSTIYDTTGWNIPMMFGLDALSVPEHLERSLEAIDPERVVAEPETAAERHRPGGLGPRRSHRRTGRPPARARRAGARQHARVRTRVRICRWARSSSPATTTAVWTIGSSAWPMPPPSWAWLLAPSVTVARPARGRSRRWLLGSARTAEGRVDWPRRGQHARFRVGLVPARSSTGYP